MNSLSLRKRILLAFGAVFFVMLPLMADPVRPTTNALPDFERLTAREGQEIRMLDQLIGVTEKNLKRQRQLKNEIEDYLKIQARYMENTDDKELGFQLVKKAHQVLEGIQDQHLTHTFDQEFLSELTFFANIAQKWESPRL